MGLKLDLEKVYDLLNWDYLLCSCLLAFGFHSHCIDLIRNCMSSVTFSFLNKTSVTFSILLNGAPAGSYSPSRGLR